MDYKLKNAGYSDSFMHTKEKSEDGITDVERKQFPVTRYGNILNRPQVITTAESMPLSDFHLLITEESEVDDDVIFDMMKQIW